MTTSAVPYPSLDLYPGLELFPAAGGDAFLMLPGGESVRLGLLLDVTMNRPTRRVAYGVIDRPARHVAGLATGARAGTLRIMAETGADLALLMDGYARHGALTLATDSRLPVDGLAHVAVGELRSYPADPDHGPSTGWILEVEWEEQ